MEITRNTIGFSAGLSVWSDPEARRWCVVVVKGTFDLQPSGAITRADEQRPLVYADEHYGEPATSSIRYECDFAPEKPEVDVLLCGHIHAPGGRPALEAVARLEVDALRKTIRASGARRWRETGLGMVPTNPEPFSRLPLRYEQAFGGSDHTHPDPRCQGAYLPNPIGIGFWKNPDPAVAAGSLLPQLEYFDRPLGAWNDTIPAAGFGVLGRSWQPRAIHAGTYGAAWLASGFPFLPGDFRMSYFQSAPADQRLPALSGGELVRAWNVSEGGFFEFEIPKVEVPVAFQFDDRSEQRAAVLDTVLIEPDERCVTLTWRTRIATGRKLQRLREIHVGRTPPRPYAVRFDGKRHYRGLNELALSGAEDMEGDDE